MSMFRASPVSPRLWFPSDATSRSVIGAGLTLAVLITAGWWALIANGTASEEAGLFATLCRPLGLSELASNAERYRVGFGLWVAMVLAMMLPSAAAMVLSFAQRVTREHGSALPAVLGLVIGYCVVWILVSAVAAGAQLALTEALGKAALPDRALAVVSGAALGFAGIYQFTSLKLASLAACRHPFSERVMVPETALGGLQLGLQQGVYCVGCCGAMMGIMLAAGTMNLFWMLGFAIIMTLEKAVVSDALPRLFGVALLIAGPLLAISSVGVEPVLHYLGLR